MSVLSKLKKNGKKIMISLAGVVAGLAALWYAFFSLTPYQVDEYMMQSHYAYKKPAMNMQIEQVTGRNFAFTYQTFDGATVNGRLAYPDDIDAIDNASTRMPVLVGVHAMGRSENRWWMESFKERPTLEQTDEITKQALAAGYAVIAIDGRNHGKRKDLDYSVRDMMLDLHLWGEREPYEAMVTDTVKDYRVLLDWIEQQSQFDQDNISVAGYSLGGQVALLLAGIDGRIENVLSIVPPHLDDKTAMVAPKNVAKRLNVDKVWLVTAKDDEYATVENNETLFNLIKANQKKHIQLDGGHILPEGYFNQLIGWYE
ncbi:alpha/beta fold hydrolase [Thalassotalea sp. Y01]|uniref:dienelactone hydrolase family protein n=1 Tax=Thalassotalea sp. Y01 TaxID=2729613 RepID=UPI00145F0688|nr:alpha/beta fold hydrolase [Thalassotalea sp. Y01]NMP17764.1 alpha/beta fold hydrolase [Thalassotalea sp. Y01]